MTYCFPCQRTFGSPGTLRQHLKTTAAHPYCQECDLGFQTDSGYRSHCKSKHTPECRPCRSTFPTWEELEEHWQTAEAHPRCNKCSMGFEEYRTYVKHMNGRHASTQCIPCSGLIILNEDLDKHYLESSRHPACSSCHAGFLDDSAFAEHSRIVHSSTHCRSCDRHFDSIHLLQSHYTNSADHPSCPRCSLGFVDDDGLNEHLLFCLPANGDMSRDSNPAESTPTKRTPLSQISILYGHHSTPSEADLTDMVTAFMTPSPSPARPQHEMGLPPFPAVNTYQSSPLSRTELSRAMSDPGASPLLGVGAPQMARSGSEMSELDLATASFGSPAAPPCIVFGHARGGLPAVPEIAVLNASLELEDGDGDDDDGDIGASNGSDAVAVSVPRLLVPEILRLRLHAAQNRRTSGGSESSGTETPSDVEDETPRAVSPFPGSVNGSPFAYPSHYGGGPSKQVTRMYCRLCERDPCETPVATMCGHVFCKGCIEDAVIKTSRCPVCEQAVLLYCLFRLHLD